MVALPDFESMADPTLSAMHSAIEAKAANRPVFKRNLGAGKLGNECDRNIFYHINDYKIPPADASLIYAAEDGHHVEDIMVERLRMVQGIEIWTKGEDGKQFGFKDLNGRLKGYADGVILGLLQAPKTPHVWENKAKSVKLYNEFLKAKQKYGEKNALREWDFGYFVQAQMLMGYLQIDRHYTTVCQQGGRAVDSCRTEFDKDFFEAQKNRAGRIINATKLPVRITDYKGHFKCKALFCDFEEQCWKDPA